MDIVKFLFILVPSFAIVVWTATIILEVIIFALRMSGFDKKKNGMNN